MAPCRFGLFAIIGVIVVLHTTTSSNETCLGEYQLCTNGVCALTDADCLRRCHEAGEYVCPITKQCVSGAEGYLECGGLKGTHLDYNLSLQQRISFLLSNLTLDEKYPQLSSEVPSIDRLGMPMYQWRSNDVHSERVPHATVFPNGCGLGATWSKQDMRKVGHVIGMEARAVHNSLVHNNNRVGYHSDGGSVMTALHCYNINIFDVSFAQITTNAPNINLVRDPRWGRAQEVYSEDPLLSAHLAREYVSGLQFGGEQEDKYLLIGAQCSCDE